MLRNLKLLSILCFSIWIGSLQAAPSVYSNQDLDDPELMLVPWNGPAFDEKGELKDPLPESFIVSTTAGSPIEEHSDEIQKTNMEIFGQLQNQSGYLGGTFTHSATYSQSRTLTLWADEESLMNFVRSEPHKNVYKNSKKFVKHWQSARAEYQNTSTLPTFADAHALIANKINNK